MQISNHITDLLYRYDCVIVPDFGAFISKRVPARIDASGETIVPPKKHLLFNEQITNNDGLLTNYISIKEGINFETANRFVSQFVVELRKAIVDRNSFELPKIGTFTTNEEGKLTFTPNEKSNYLTEAFGLDVVGVSEVEREVAVEEELEELEIATVVTEDKEEIVAKKYNYGAVKYAASVAIIAGIGSYLMWNQNNNSFANQQTEVSMRVQKELQEATFSIDIENPLPSITLNVIKAKPAEELVKPFHIIAGAFREQQNADKLIAQLKQKGFEASYLGTNKYGLHQVAYQSFANKSDAVTFLRDIKRTENKSAWILTK